MTEFPHLILVDDDQNIRQLNACLIESLALGHVTEVDSVASLLTCLEDKRQQKIPIDLILMDIMMPECDGIEGCRRVHSQEAYQDIPIVMLTSLRDDSMLEAAFEAGAIDYISKPFSSVELRARLKSILRLKQEMDKRREHEQELMAMTQSLILQQAQFERATYMDALTGIYNRRAFDKKLQDDWLGCLNQDLPLSVVLLDIDYFKRYNDCYGHQAGDQCLKQVASCLPQPDTNKFAARYGGEEFALILPGCSLEQAVQEAEAIRQAVEYLRLSHVESEASSWVTVSLGVACGRPTQLANSSQLVLSADQALYQAKSQGRNCVVF